MPRGGARQGAGRKPFPDFKPEGIVIDVRDCVAYVSRWERVGAAFQLVEAYNSYELLDAASDEVSAVGGYITMSGIYPCSAELAAKGEWKMNSKNNVVWLYEDNAGGLYIGRDGGPWYQVDGKPGKFEDDATGFAYTDDMDLEYSVIDGKLDAEPQAKLVAKWEDGAVTVLNNTLVGSAPAGHAAAAYLGIKRE